MKPMNFPRRRAKRRLEAEARQAVRDKLTPKQQMAKLEAQGLTAGKETARLLKLYLKGH